MGRVRVATVIDASPAEVWRKVAEVASHVDWMADAVAIRFVGRRRSGVGTTFDCDTRIGPFRLTDRMEVTEWRPRRAMGVRHTGLVTGTGRFILRRVRGGRTRFTWDERLDLPWWMPGPIVIPVLRRVWRGNLARLKASVEAGG